MAARTDGRNGNRKGTSKQWLNGSSPPRRTGVLENISPLPANAQSKLVAAVIHIPAAILAMQARTVRSVGSSLRAFDLDGQDPPEHTSIDVPTSPPLN